MDLKSGKVVYSKDTFDIQLELFAWKSWIFAKIICVFEIYLLKVSLTFDDISFFSNSFIVHDARDKWQKEDLAEKTEENKDGWKV